MQISFSKYQGTGNDFVMIDNRTAKISLELAQIAALCDRRFGVGADGVILLQEHPELDFEMVYYNSDGSQSFCGNGSRCAIAFARELGMIGLQTRFLAIDGIHEGKVESDGRMATKMGDVRAVQRIGEDWFIHTGSPHYIQWVDDVSPLNVKEKGSAIRYSESYRAEGTNVNFVSQDEQIRVRTYERGVEDETLSCGTGVTAVALATHLRSNSTANKQWIQTQGGTIEIRYRQVAEDQFEDIWLVGPAEAVYEGQITL